MKCTVCSSLIIYYQCVLQDITNIVCCLDGGGFVGDSQYLTFVRVEFPFYYFSQSVEGIEVTLEVAESSAFLTVIRSPTYLSTGDPSCQNHKQDVMVTHNVTLECDVIYAGSKPPVVDWR